MARVYTGAGAWVDINPPSLAQMLNQLIPAVKKGANTGAKQSLIDLRNFVRSGIEDYSLGLDPLKQATLISRAMGKTVGNFPARNKFSGITPLKASGQTLRGIKIDGTALSIGFDQSATITYSRGNMAKVAENQESGFTIRGTYTKKMLAYLHILFKKQFGKKGRIFGQGHARLGVAYTRGVAPRPAWERATQRAIPRIANNFATAITLELRARGII